jgi:sec-independent protein translocase protein TatC
MGKSIFGMGRNAPKAPKAAGSAGPAPPQPQATDEVEASRAPLMDHLIELRNRLVVCLVAIGLASIFAFIFSTEIYTFLLQPFEAAASNLGRADGKPLELIFTGPMEFFLVKVKLALFGGLILAFPVVAWNVYRFIAPGLYKHERAAALPFMLAAPVMFGLGAAFVHYVMMPLVMQFALGQEVAGGDGPQVSLLPRVSEYLSLVTALIIAFGLSFQLPVVLTLMGTVGLVGVDFLRKGRKYALVLILMFAAVFTPPDVLSQVLLATPVYLLYEISIWLVAGAERSRAKREAAEAASAA